MGTEKIIESDLEQGSGVSGRKPPERRPVVGDEPDSPLSPDEQITVERPETPEEPQRAEKSAKSAKTGKKGFDRISFDKKNESDIFSD
jgi:hypothetical protein